MIRPDGTQSAKVIQVIETKSKRGMGTEKDPLIEYDAKVVKESIYAEAVPHP